MSSLRKSLPRARYPSRARTKRWDVPRSSSSPIEPPSIPSSPYPLAQITLRRHSMSVGLSREMKKARRARDLAASAGHMPAASMLDGIRYPAGSSSVKVVRRPVPLGRDGAGRARTGAAPQPLSGVSRGRKTASARRRPGAVKSPLLLYSKRTIPSSRYALPGSRDGMAFAIACSGATNQDGHRPIRPRLAL